MAANRKTARVRRISNPDIDCRFRYGDAVREFLRGAVRLHILHHAAEHEVHGAFMTEELARHGYAISPGSLYPTLHQMESEQLLSSRTLVVGGRTRRVYRTTALGERALEEARQQLRELAREVLGEDHP